MNAPWKRVTLGEKTFETVLYIVLVILGFLTIYPLLYILSNSISADFPVLAARVWLFPQGFDTTAYRLLLKRDNIWMSYYNTVWYTVVGTAINVSLTLLVAYPLSKTYFFFRKYLMFIIAFTMWFSGGLIPRFILINKLGLYNTRWAIVLPTAIGAWNVIITRTYFRSAFPEELAESAKIDGAGDFSIFLRLVLPVSGAIIAVNALFYAVGHWNDFFSALLYLSNNKLHPIQLLLRNILIQQNQSILEEEMVVSDFQSAAILTKMRYAIVVITILPIIMVYPFLQRHFVQGVMIGSLKG